MGAETHRLLKQREARRRHYYKYWTPPLPAANKSPCIVVGCERMSRHKIGYCAMHYKRWTRHGTTDAPGQRIKMDEATKLQRSKDSCAKYRWKNRDVVNAKNRVRSKMSPEKVRAKNRRYHEQNPGWRKQAAKNYRAKPGMLEALAESTRLWRLQNPERSKEAKRKYNSENPGRVRFWSSNRNARKAQATPIWETAADRARILAMHTEAARLTVERGEPYHVDHVIPIAGRKVCGLHVPANLQVLRGTDNAKKHNHFTHEESL